MKHLGLLDRDNEYTMVIIYVASNQETHMKGLKFTDSADEVNTSEPDGLTLDDRSGITQVPSRYRPR